MSVGKKLKLDMKGGMDTDSVGDSVEGYASTVNSSDEESKSLCQLWPTFLVIMRARIRLLLNPWIWGMTLLLLTKMRM